MSAETSGRATNFRQLEMLTQSVIYGLFVSSFQHDTFEEQVGSALSLTLGMCGCHFESDEQAVAVIGRAAKAVCAIALEHGRLIQRDEIAALWEQRAERGGQPQ